MPMAGKADKELPSSERLWRGGRIVADASVERGSSEAAIKQV